MTITLLDRYKGCQAALNEARFERDALAAVLRSLTHEFQPHISADWCMWRDHNDEACGEHRVNHVHATPEVVLDGGPL